MGPMGGRAIRQAISTPLVVMNTYMKQPLVRIDAVAGDNFYADPLVCALNDMAWSGFDLYEILYLFHRRSVRESLTSCMMDLRGHQRNGTGTMGADGKSRTDFCTLSNLQRPTAADRMAPHPTSTRSNFSDVIKVGSAE